MHFESEPNAVITVELIGGDLGRPVTLDNDGIIVMRIKNTTETVKVVATKDGNIGTKTYSLANLILLS